MLLETLYCDLLCRRRSRELRLCTAPDVTDMRWPIYRYAFARALNRFFSPVFLAFSSLGVPAPTFFSASFACLFLFIVFSLLSALPMPSPCNFFPLGNANGVYTRNMAVSPHERHDRLKGLIQLGQLIRLNNLNSLIIGITGQLDDLNDLNNLNDLKSRPMYHVSLLVSRHDTIACST